MKKRNDKAHPFWNLIKEDIRTFFNILAGNSLFKMHTWN
ncbi:MAG: hypothetical protein BWY20_02304 [Spirochaetes bacterium ADurb.Bin215]|jgi:hypothetical protein|nr:MAG: hypothetical protein BWY20_02304 [Spirochaetes bacterium ADurb.Bin215]